MGITLDEESKNIVWIAKGIAVIAIVACHCCHVNENASFFNVASNAIMNFWIGLGVPVFYFFAGYFMKNEGLWLEFWKKKFFMIIVPWIVTGSVVWLYVVLRKGGFSFENWIEFVLLKKSYLYFLTDLIVFYLLTWFIRGKKAIKVAIGTLIVLLFINEIYPVAIIDLLGKYLNLNNYIVFLLGKCIEYEGKFYLQNNKVNAFVILGWAVLRFLQVNNLYTPYVLGSSVITLVGIYSIICMAVWINDTRISDLLRNWGKTSFSIYLLHMPIAGVIANLLNRSEYFAPLTIVRPIIVIFITMLFIRMYSRLFTKDVFKVLIGYRE